MKRIVSVAIICLLLAGCGQAARESGFYKHDTMYRDWDHLWFSWVGYKQVTVKDAQESKADGWWGIEEDVKEK